MNNEKIAKFIGKINRLFEQKHKVEFLKSENSMKLDKLTFVEELHESCSGNHFWEWAIYYDFLPNPVLSGEEAKEVVKHLNRKNKDFFDQYLNN